MLTEGPVAGFIQKLYTIMEDYSISHIIGWADNDIHIRDKTLFIEEVLPRYFRHRRMESFVRQLNLYGFKKVQKADKEAILFRHISFRRNGRSSLGQIQLKNKNSLMIKEPDAEDIQEQIRNSQNLLQLSQTNFKQTLFLIDSKLRKLTKENPIIETELKSTFALLTICSASEDSLLLPTLPSNYELRDTLNIIKFDSRLSF